jgi:hypothetical protein
MSTRRSERSAGKTKASATGTSSSSKNSEKKRSVRRYSSSTEGEDQGNDDEGSVYSLVGDAGVVTPAKTPGKQASTPATGESSASSKARRKNNIRTNSRGLPVPDQKFLAEDLEGHGGLLQVLATPSGLTTFCNQQAERDEHRKEFYGEYGSTSRVRIENKIRNWYRISPDEYQKLLVGWQVWPAEHRQNNPTAVYSSPKPEPAYSTPKPEPAYSSPKPEPTSSAFKPPSVVKFNTTQGQPIGDFKSFRTPKRDLSSSDKDTPKTNSAKRKQQIFTGSMSEEGKRLASENGKFSALCTTV